MGAAMGVLGGAVSAGSGILGAVKGGQAANSGYNKALGAENSALQNFQNTQAPTSQDLQVTLDKLVSQGQLTPEQETAFMQNPSAMNNISIDPSVMAAQQSALSKLQQIGNSNTLDPEAQAQLNQALATTNANNSANQNAILSQEAERGMAGSGSELASRLSAQQGNATQASNAGFNAAADAQQRALTAIQQGAQLGNQMQNTSFGEQAATANANDAINRFNTQNSQNVANSNVNSNNIAQQQNLMNNQNISNQNVGIANQNKLYNANTQQTAYNDQMGKNAAEANIYGNESNLDVGKGKSNQTMWGGIGSAGAQLGGAIGGMPSFGGASQQSSGGYSPGSSGNAEIDSYENGLLGSE